jgi:hypothetical protein
MTTTAIAPDGFSIGRVINRLFGVLGRNLAMFLLLSALLVGAPTALVNIGQLSIRDTAATGTALGAQIALIFAGVIVSLACNAVLQGAVINATVNDLAGRKASFGESLAVGLRYFLPLVGISLIVGIGCGLGVIFFIVPGILLALVWCVAAPAEVMERVGVLGALSRSRELTRNHRGAIFVLGLGYFVVVWIVEAAITAVVLTIGLGAGFTAAGGRALAGVQTLAWVQAGFGLVANTLLASLSSAGIASIYFELRQAKEGVGVEQLAAVFD